MEVTVRAVRCRRERLMKLEIIEEQEKCGYLCTSRSSGDLMMISERVLKRLRLLQ